MNNPDNVTWIFNLCGIPNNRRIDQKQEDINSYRESFIQGYRARYTNRCVTENPYRSSHDSVKETGWSRGWSRANNDLLADQSPSTQMNHYSVSFINGYRARYSDIGLSENPHQNSIDPIKESGWISGWQRADTDLQRNGLQKVQSR